MITRTETLPSSERTLTMLARRYYVDHEEAAQAILAAANRDIPDTLRVLFERPERYGTLTEEGLEENRVMMCWAFEMAIATSQQERGRVTPVIKMYYTSFRASLAGAWQMFAVILSGLSVYNAIVKYFNLPVIDLFRLVLNAYRTLIHPMVDILLLPLTYWYTIEVPEYAKDLLFAYLVIGSAFARTLTSGEIYWKKRGYFSYLVGSKALKFISRFLAATVVWPAMIIPLFWKSYVYRVFHPAYERSEPRTVQTRCYLGPIAEFSFGIEKVLGYYAFNIRHMFAVQLTGVVAVAVLLSTINAFGISLPK